jgi:DNA-binding beta-propeller fold protein YncE
MSRSSAGLKLVMAAAALALPMGAHAQTFKVDRSEIGGVGGTDYLMAEPGTGRVFVSRSSHVMVVDGPTGKVLGDIPDSPGNHGIALSQKSNHGFTTNSGDSTLTMFDLKTLAVIKKLPMHTAGLDGIMYDDFNDRIILTNHSRPIGTVTVVDAKTGDIVGTVNLADNAPEGAASDGKGKLFVNLEGKSMIEVIDAKAMKSLETWPLAPCEGPTGIAIDRTTNRLFVGCGKISVVVDAKSGKVVAQITNGDGVDALGWDQSQKLIYIPANGGRGAANGTVTIVHEDSPDKYTVVGTVNTTPGAKTIAVDPVKHMAYLFQPEYGPAPAPAAGTPPPAPGRGGRGPRGPIIGAWFFAISH